MALSLDSFLADVADVVARESRRNVVDLRSEIATWRAALGGYSTIDQLSRYFNTPEFVATGAIDSATKRIMREELAKRSPPAVLASRSSPTPAVVKTPISITGPAKEFRQATFGTRAASLSLKGETPSPRSSAVEVGAKGQRSFTGGESRAAGSSLEKTLSGGARDNKAPAVVVAAAAAVDPISEGIERIFQLAQQKGSPEVKLNGRPLQKTHIKLITKLLKASPIVTSLELRSASLDDACLTSLSKWIRKERFCSLTSLDVSENKFKSTSLDALCAALQDNFSIVTLKIPEQASGAQLASDTIHAFSMESTTQLITQKINFILWANKQYQLVKSNSHVYNIMQIQNRTLSSFPEEVATFESLVILEVSKCELKSLPPTIMGLVALTKLNLSNNELESLPGQIGLLTKLEELVLAQNHLTSLPPALHLLVRLKDLNLSNNRLTELPKFLGGLPELKTLQCGKNPFRKDMVVPKNIVSKGDEAILTYLQALHGVGDGSLDTIKVAFVGTTGAGKTSLLQSLKIKDREKDSKSKSRPAIPSTEGIDVSQFIAEDGSLILNAWDFGGAPIYGSTHTFFFTPNTLYMLVANVLDEQVAAKLDYWLSVITARAGKAPVIVVGTRLDEVSKEQLKSFVEVTEGLRNTYKTILSICCVSNITLKGIKEVHKEILRIANAHDWTRKVVPRSYRLMHYRLAAIKDTGKYPYFTYNQLQALAAEMNVSKGEFPTVTDVLTTMGTIAYCPYVKAANTQIALLDPQWLTNAFVLLLQTKNSVAREGVISADDLQVTWALYPVEIHSFLIALFRQYELVFLLTDGSLLVPLTLKEQRPSAAEVERARAEFDGRPEASRVFVLSFLPPGIMGRALIRFLTKGWKCHLMWLDGFLVSQNDACAFLEYDSHEGLIRTTIVANQLAPVLTTAIEEILLLLREYPRMRYTEQLPCPHCNMHRFGIDELKDLATAGQSAQCLSTRQVISIPQLLPGIEVAAPRTPTSVSGKSSISGAVPVAAKQSLGDVTACRQLENVILEVHRLNFSHTLAERVINETEAKREEVAQGFIESSNLGARLASRANDLHNSITTKAIAHQISGLDLKDLVRSSMTALQATSNAVREEIIALEDQIADAKIEPLKNTARRPGSNPGTKKTKKLDMSVAGAQINALDGLMQKLENVVTAPAVLQAANARMEEKRKQYEAGLKALKEQIAALESVQAEMVKESQLIAADCGRMKTIQRSLATIEQLAKKGELLDGKNLAPAAAAALKELDPGAEKPKFSELAFLPAQLPPDSELDFPDLKLQKQENSEHPTPRAGTVPRLIERLTWAKHPDFAYQSAFLLTYRSFLAPLELLQCLVIRYCAVPSPGADHVATLDQQVPIRLRVLSVLRYWVDNFYDDFRQSPDLMEMLMNFLDNIVGLSGNKQFVTQIKTALEKKREGLERMRIIVKQPPPPALLPEGWPMGGRWTLMDVEPVEVARQLSLLALELLQNIQPAELLGAAWTKADKLVRSPNVMKSIQHFNKLSMFVLEDVAKREDITNRRNALRRWIVVAKECLRLSNYSTVLSLVAALEHTIIHRLKKTWAALGDDVTAVYAELSPFTGSNYSKLKELVRTGPRPCVPYLGIYLTDLVFQEELPDRTEEGLVNFAKNRKVAGIIQQLTQMQEQSYNFTPVPEIRELMLNYDEKDEETLTQMSYRAEPRSDNQLAKP